MLQTCVTIYQILPIGPIYGYSLYVYIHMHDILCMGMGEHQTNIKQCYAE